MKTKRKNRNYHIILVLGIIFLSICSRSTRDIPKYYKNMLYASTFNAVYYFLCKRHLVWEFVPSGIHWLVIRLIHICIVTPLLVLTFLSGMPNSSWNQFKHYLKWVVIATCIEYLVHKKNLILYAHGWNVFWSSILYIKMFLYSHLFTKRPITTLILSFFSTVFFVHKLNVPLKWKHYSKYIEPLVDMYYHTSMEDLINMKRKLL
jgi:hypothetical protein